MFKWDKGGIKPMEEDDEIVMCNEFVHPKDDLMDLINEVNSKGCRPIYKDEPRFEEHINKAVLQYSFTGAWQDFFSILAHNGYEVTAKVVNDEMVVTWKDKNDLVEEIKREARKIEETL